MEKQEEEKQTKESPRKRKPYQPPRVETEEVFETLTFACGKVGGVSFACMQNPKNS